MEKPSVFPKSLIDLSFIRGEEAGGRSREEKERVGVRPLILLNLTSLKL